MHNTSKCFPSRGTLLTRLYPQQCGMDRRPGKLTNGIFFGSYFKRSGRVILSGAQKVMTRSASTITP